MRYLQFICTLICLLLAAMLFQLHRLQPLTTGDLQSVSPGRTEEYAAMRKRIPVVHLNEPLRVNLPLRTPLDVNVVNEVEVKNSSRPPSMHLRVKSVD
ncbi:hypothetical protein [Luteolibacter flavescens]|uniref:hypothetical protein n=1 Tax=Luteolibacter flavescens TaxID=1859460 RepID=UPI0022232F9E|nr:hypothetical protein [Luteolibacter flavescens]